MLKSKIFIGGVLMGLGVESIALMIKELTWKNKWKRELRKLEKEIKEHLERT